MGPAPNSPNSLNYPVRKKSKERLRPSSSSNTPPSHNHNRTHNSSSHNRDRSHVHFQSGPPSNTNWDTKPENTTPNTTSNTGGTEIPVRKPPATASGDQKSDAPPTYQNPGPGFNHTVANVPGIGLVYNGANPATVQQAQQHQTFGFLPSQPQVLPPGFTQNPTDTFPPQFTPANHQPTKGMAYVSFMPNQGQHFQPPVPDTTYGPIPHTYHPRFDNQAVSGQYMTIDGQIYKVVNPAYVQDGTQYVQLQQQGSQGAQGTSSAAPILLQQRSAPQGPVLVQAQSGPPFLGQQAQMATQPGPFPGMVNQPSTIRVVGGPGVMPTSAPDVMGIGKTGLEKQMEQYHTALNTGALEGQDIAPADPDPSRMYYCRELDGEWTLRNRFSIDNMGDWRWYVVPENGIFYAVRIAD
ncbi:uncharacterized protein F4822DRAFT_14152 [Hypoxylon trugodes]|uniref:uncharacterized protein n=1 Tax=Hypoxylon trugodes TaxID=326681 RepID=UPI002190F927|nr:uncharacterized protein F4822DRAFT_14152 [Hypoxylon trugodes]KAI1393471.1 hypothetical protein F4822DRAFT_14152 [Hypoxylon trugodes]